MCKYYKTSPDNDRCICDECEPGYYLDADNKCTNTIDNCFIVDSKMTTFSNCFACKIGIIFTTFYFCNMNNYICDILGYKWKTDVCIQCTEEDPCATTGCASLKNPNTLPARGDASAMDSGILRFIINILLVLVTLVM